MIRFFVAGDPAAKGSRSFFHDGTGQVKNRESSAKVAPWMSIIRVVSFASRPSPIWTGPVEISLEFIMKRPKSHYIANDPTRGLKSNAPYWHTKKKDFDKLERAVFDALTGVYYHDDGQICRLNRKEKHYTVDGQVPGVRIIIGEIEK